MIRRAHSIALDMGGVEGLILIEQGQEFCQVGRVAAGGLGIIGGLDGNAALGPALGYGDVGSGDAVGVIGIAAGAEEVASPGRPRPVSLSLFMAVANS